MNIKNLIIVPCDTVVEDHWLSRARFLFKKEANRLAIALGRSGFSYDGEVQFYGDIPKAVGGSAYILGQYHPHLLIDRVPRDCPYPSSHGVARGTAIRWSELDATLSKVDAVFVSIRSQKAREVMMHAKKKGIPRALFDFEDHHQNYGAADPGKELTRGFREGEDYEIYFKKDLPLGFKTDKVLPLAPIAIRPESYQVSNIPKTVSLFYSGRARPGCQADRDETIALTRNMKDALVLDHTSRDTFISTEEYWRHLGEAKMALSPSGKVWDSFRHCEVGLAPKTLLIAPEPYTETVGPPLIDDKNAILYETVFREGKYHLSNSSALLEKIKYYLENDQNRERLADAWARDVREGHTVLARSKDILIAMEKEF